MTPSEINILIACEESQAECKAFRELGFNCFSCDLQRPRYKEEWHILGDVTELLQGGTRFDTMNGFPEIADAIAQQWGQFILDELNK